MRIGFLSKGSPDQISGGYLYNRYLIEYLRESGHEVTYCSDPVDLPSIHAADVVVVDSIVIDQVLTPLLSVPAEIVLLLHVVPCLEASGSGTLGLLRALCRRSRLVVTGDSTMLELKQIVARQRTDVVKIEPGVPTNWRAKTHYAQKAETLLGLANYIRGKGISETLDFLRQLQHLPWTMTLHGNRELDPEYFELVSNKVDKYGLSNRVELAGPISHGLVNDTMLGSDLLVHFSLHESYSMVTAEAIACGLPVISYKTGNFTSFSRSGLVCYQERGESSEIAALAALMSDGDRYSSLRLNGDWKARTCQDVGSEFLRMLERDE